MIRVALAILSLSGAPLWTLAQTPDPTSDTAGATDNADLVSQIVVSLISTSPLAAFAIVQMNRAQGKLDKQEASAEVKRTEAERDHKAELTKKDEEIIRLRNEGQTRERELVMRFGNIIYDSALLYKEGNVAVEQLSRRVVTREDARDAADKNAVPQGAELLSAIQTLTEAMNRGHDGEHDDVSEGQGGSDDGSRGRTS